MEENYDVIIVGTGIAGLFCALHLPDHMKILMITKEKVEKSDSFLAQGGICVLKNALDFEAYVQDTLKAGKYENNREAVEVMIGSSREVINELLALDVGFDQENGQLLYTKEAAHSTNRILHHADVTGEEITSKLLQAVQRKENITIYEYCEMIDLIRDEERAIGIVANKQGDYTYFYGQSIVLATGGIGGIFKASTNYAHITGDGVAIALRHGIEVEHINYIQIHPTTLYSQEKGKRFLISEAVRGEGAYLLNEKRERFVDELLPRDIVSQVIRKEMDKFKTDHVYLSLKHLDGNYVKKRFPHIYSTCQQQGYDLTCDDIPVTPAQHYFMGGIKVDLNSRTSLKGLYAIGETSCTGVHGANRLASNSLLEALVFSKRAARDIQGYSQGVKSKANIATTILEGYSIEQIQQLYKEILLQSIKRKDEEFYARWCHEQHQCG